MNKNFLIAVMAATTILSGSAIAKDYSASVSYEWGKFAEAKVNQIIPIQKITEEMMNKVMEGECQGVAIECTAGVSIPVKPFLKGDLVHLSTASSQAPSVEILKTFYLKSDGKEILFSHDLQDWKGFFEFITGSAAVSVGVKEGELVADVGAELNIR